MKFPRRSGVLLHPTCLPGRFGIGDLGEAAYRFIDFLVSAGQSYWQVLPLSPTGYGDSPYQTLSAFAGNPMLISLDKLVEIGHLSATDLQIVPEFPDSHVDFGPVIQYKTEMLDRAFENFRARSADAARATFARFCRDQRSWLDDFALFMALKEAHALRPWHEWEHDIATREAPAIRRERRALADAIVKFKYRQWLFAEQWHAVKQYANEHGIRIIGDIPIFVSEDSADVWANIGLFSFGKDLRPTVVSGVPPDYFSKFGQLWGHPLYRWDEMANDGFAWWIARFRAAFAYADLARIDHFRGFYNYWQVPAGAPNAVKGRWLRAPGAELFRAVKAKLGDLTIIAEDLGDFNKASRAGVDALQTEFGFPGMKVVQFGFSSNSEDPFLPHNFTRDFVAYTGTHDNDTAVGWYQASSTEHERDYARRYMRCDGSDIAWDLIRLTWASVANTAITTAQDLLSLGHEARMNTPSTVGPPNWCWRVLADVLNDGVAARLLELTTVYGRAPTH